MHLKDCPFCGFTPKLDDPDTLYPMGIVWNTQKDGTRCYQSSRVAEYYDGTCYQLNCVETAGGSSANITGDSKEECIAKWNWRTPNEIL